MEKKMKKFAMTDQTKRILIAILFIIVIGIAGIVTILSSTHFLKSDNPTNEAKGPGVENGYVYVNPASKIVPNKGQAVPGGEASTTAYAGETDTTAVPTSVDGDDTIPGASYAAEQQSTNSSSSNSADSLENNTTKGTVTKTINNLIDSIGNEIKSIANTISGNSSTSSSSEGNATQVASSNTTNSSVSDNNQDTTTNNDDSSASSSTKANTDDNSASSKDSSSDVKNNTSQTSSNSNESANQQKNTINLNVKSEK